MSPASNDELIHGYLELQRRRGYMPETLKWKRWVVDGFAAWLSPRVLGDAREDDVDEFLDTLGLAPRTRYQRISQLHVFYEFAVARGLVDRDPTITIVRPKLPALFPRPIGDDDLEHALEQSVVRPDRRAWLLLMAYGGFRCCEVARLDRADVLDTNDPPVFVVRGKGRKDRVVPAHPMALEALRAMGMPTRGRVFHRVQGGAWPAKHLSAQTSAFLADIGVNATAHQLRHWFGTHLYSETRDIRLVQEIMGHSDPKTTAIYTRWADERAYGAVISLDVRRAARAREGKHLPAIAPRPAQSA